MSPELWARVEALYNELAELPPAEWARRLEAIPDAALRQEVGTLLEAGPLTRRVHGAISDAAVASTAPSERRFGPWRVIRTIGYGGMGTVYEAVRDDQAFDKRVALKVLQAGLDTPYLVERFRQERSILAGLEHPNIARLLDGGESESGLSYFAMEYVDGVDIAAYTRSLGRDEILSLFLRVCSAVQYAHQNLIVHRDLKPGNILVTREGEPKLLDFGIAKLLEPSALQTVTGLQALTPQYASPEQVRGENVTTASDVYTLGLILYELLTGRRPYSVEGASVATIAQIICLTEPAPPRLDSDLDNILLMALRKEPQRRYPSVSHFAADISRYCEGLPVEARDDTLTYRARKFVVRNRLPVAAAAAVFLSLVAGVAVAWNQAREAGAARQVAEVQKGTAERERARAESEAAAAVRERARAESEAAAAVRERARAETEAGIARKEQARSELRLNQMVSLADRALNEVHNAIERLPGSIAARRKVVATTLQFLQDLSKDAAHDDRLRLVLADGYIKVGDVLGFPFVSNLGDSKGALENFARAAALVEPLLAKEPERADYLHSWIVAKHQAAVVLTVSGETARGAEEDLKILPAALKMPRLCPAKPDCWLLAPVIYSNLAESYRQRDSAQSFHYTSLHRNSLEEAFRALPQNDQIRLELSIACSREGAAFNRHGDLRQASASLERALTLREDYLARHPTDGPLRRNQMITYANLAANLGGVFVANLGDPAGARRYYERALAIARELAAADPANVLAQYDLGNALFFYATVDLPPAERAASLKLLREAEEILKKVIAADPGRVAAVRTLSSTQLYLGRRLAEAGQLDAALSSFRESLATAAKPLARDAGDLGAASAAVEAEQGIGEVLARQGDRGGAVEFVRRAVARVEKIVPPESERGRIASYVADAYRSLAVVHAALGEWKDARAAAEHSVKVWRDLLAAGGKVGGMGRMRQAEEVLRTAVDRTP